VDGLVATTWLRLCALSVGRFETPHMQGVTLFSFLFFSLKGKGSLGFRPLVLDPTGIPARVFCTVQLVPIAQGK